MSCLNRFTLVLLTTCAVAQAHVVSISNGELRITGKIADFELRIPAYEVETIANPETAVLNEFHFGDASRTSATCKKDQDWLTCNATYEFTQPVSDKLDVECTLYRITVPNHIHMLYAVQGENSDQRVFDQNTSVREMRFRPPSFWESAARDGGAGALRLLKSPAGLLFLVVIALAATSVRDALLLTVMFLTSEWLIRPISPFIPLSLSPEFLEALIALAVAYLAGELAFLGNGSARWVLVPLLGLVNGLPFVAFPPMYLAGGALVQTILLGTIATATLRMPSSRHKHVSVGCLVTALAWFAFLMFT